MVSYLFNLICNDCRVCFRKSFAAMRLKIKSTVVLIVLPVRGTESIFTATLKTRNSYFFCCTESIYPGLKVSYSPQHSNHHVHFDLALLSHYCLLIREGREYFLFLILLPYNILSRRTFFLGFCKV